MERLIALAGQTRVERHKRTTKTGKVVDVDSHLRSVASMPNLDLFNEYDSIKDSNKPQDQNRKQQVVNEIRKRQQDGSWKQAEGGGDAPQRQQAPETDAAPAKRQSAVENLAKKTGAEPPKRGGGDNEQQTPAPEEDGSAWKPGAEHATEHFVNEKNEKLQSEGGAYEPTPEERQRWEASVEALVSATITDPGQISDLTTGTTTASPHLVHNPDGTVTFTPERQALHKKIISAFLDGYKPQDRPRYHMMGGGPASGKSVMERANPEISEGNAVINADEAKGMIPEAWQEDGSMDAGLAHEESSYLAKLVQQEAFNRRLGVTLDGTGDGGLNSVRRKLEQARAGGYEVHGYYVSTNVDEAIKRAAGRASKPPYREVPEGILRKTHSDVSKVFPQIMNEFDTVKLYDSTSREGVLTGEKSRGGKFEIRDQKAWKDFLDKADID